VGRAATEQLQAQVHMLQQVDAAVETGESGLTRTLLNLDVTGGGRAVIAIGDLATADYVSFLVPGMFYSVDSEIGSWANAADQLAVDQSTWLARLTPAQHAGSQQSVATVAWIGYQTPTVVNVASLDLAREGRDALTRSLRGLEAIRTQGGQAPYVSVLAHSYGATAALLALQENDVTVDALAMVGSPGSPAENVGQLRVRDGNVWVADAALDPIASSGVFGSQPLSASYGAHHFGVEGAVDPLTGRRLAGSVGHVDYFTAGSESFRNLALIGIGQGRLVLDASGASAAAPRALAG
jgi:pimeloyl-ACP methyl ester carboxylesterase